MKSDSNNRVTISQRLDSIDYSIDPNYVPTKFALEFINFVKMVNGESQEKHKTPVMHYKMLDSLVHTDDDAIINMVFRGGAKALPLDTMLPTPKGWVSMGDLEVGEEVYSELGMPTKILHKSVEFYNPIYRIELEDGRKFRASIDHLHQIYLHNSSTGKEVKQVVDTYKLDTLLLQNTSEIYLDITSPVFTSKNFDDILCSKDRKNKFITEFITKHCIYKKGFFRCKLREIPYTEKKITQVLYSLGLKVFVSHGNLKFNCNSYLSKLLANVYGKVKVSPNADRIKVLDMVLVTTKFSQCISVDNPTKLFLTENFIVTHNTSIWVEYVIFYVATYGYIAGYLDIAYMLFVGDTIENGVNNLGENLRYKYSQSSFLQKFVPKAKFIESCWTFENISGHKLWVDGFGAQALSLSSLLFSEKGTTNIRNCFVGQKIFGSDGKLTTIVAKSEIFNKPMYQIELLDSRALQVSEDHINVVIYKGNRTTMDTKELLSAFEEYSEHIYIPYTKPLDGTKSLGNTCPYVLGLLLTASNTVPTVSYNQLRRVQHNSNLKFSAKHISGDTYRLQFYEIIQHHYVYTSKLANTILNSSLYNRIDFLKGIYDMGVFTHSFRGELTEEVQGLITLLRYSLGDSADTAEFDPNVYFSYREGTVTLEELLGGLPTGSQIVSVHKIDTVPSQCIQVDNESKEFLTQMYIPTHNSGIRGSRKYGQRPKIAIFDDLLKDSQATSPAAIKRIGQAVTRAIEYAVDPNDCLKIWNGTPFNARDPMYKAAESGVWTVNVHPVCEKFPVTKQEFKGAWEDRFSWESVNKKWNIAVESQDVAGFNQELMLRILGENERIIPESKILFYEDSDVISKLEEYNIYITTDYGMSESSSGDFSAVSVWALGKDLSYNWIDGYLRKQSMRDNIRDTFDLVKKYNIMGVGIEISAQQKGFISLFEKEMSSQNTYFHMFGNSKKGSKGILPTGSKINRFLVAIPDFSKMKFRFPNSIKNTSMWTEMHDQLSHVTTSSMRSRHDDFLDTISMLYLLPLVFPTGAHVLEGTQEVNKLNPSDPFYLDDQDSLYPDSQKARGVGRYVVA